MVKDSEKQTTDNCQHLTSFRNSIRGCQHPSAEKFLLRPSGILRKELVGSLMLLSLFFPSVWCKTESTTWSQFKACCILALFPNQDRGEELLLRPSTSHPYWRLKTPFLGQISAGGSLKMPPLNLMRYHHLLELWKPPFPGHFLPGEMLKVGG
jgi:hypothetical protein